MARSVSVLQANLNHARQAQDLFVHSLLERGFGIGVASEPYTVPDGPRWAGDSLGSVAITWTDRASPPCRPRSAGEGYVAVEHRGVTVVGVYIPPSLDLEAFEARLDALALLVRALLPGRVVLAGDFNAKSVAWGSPRTDRRGAVLEGWAAGLGLLLMNEGATSTCVAWRGESIVDLTWTSPSAGRLLGGWRVVEELDTLSDHLYVEFRLSLGPPARLRPGPGSADDRGGDDVRWVLSKLDEDLLTAALWTYGWSGGPAATRDDDDDVDGRAPLEDEVGWLRGALRGSCDVSMPRARAGDGRRTAYWWTEAIADLRRASVRARRGYLRARRARDPLWAGKYEEYRLARGELRAAIRSAKRVAWEGLLAALDEDPWGRPYRMVLNKFRPRAPPVVETLEPGLLGDIVGRLFPPLVGGEDSAGPPLSPLPALAPEGDRAPEVTEEEFSEVARRLRGRKAPGPDGVHRRVLRSALEVLGGSLRDLLSRCLREGVFPRVWKQARLVLLKKEGKPDHEPSSYRPICLLDEAGKMLERVIADRLVRHIEGPGGRGLDDAQFGFRGGRSTVDAIKRVRALAEEAVASGGVALAVSLDIANAFNTLPWSAIASGLDRQGVPAYLGRIVRSYLDDRSLSYRDGDGLVVVRSMERGVPQGSVLGPLLWNVGYDPLLGMALPPGCELVCYADDTLVLAEGENWEEARGVAELATACVVAGLRRLGLEVSPRKTEAMYFASAGGPPRPLSLRVAGTPVRVGAHIKYLGLILDGRWGFGEHFARLAPRLGRMAAALGRLMPNMGGPGGGCRRLYASVVQSVALYGAPIWAADLSRRGPEAAAAARVIRDAQRRVAVRVARTYRTAAYAAVTALAGMVPWVQLARALAGEYHRAREARTRGLTGGALAQFRARDRRQSRKALVEEWARQLAHVGSGQPGHRTASALGPILPRWLAWVRGGRGTFHVAQVVVGHGCFGDYLCRIGKEETALCWQCGAEQDSAQHALAECPSSREGRAELSAALGIGGDLSLPTVMSAVTGSPERWSSFVSFCGAIMLRRETDERVREGRRRALARPAAGLPAVPPPPPPPPPRRRRFRRLAAGGGGGGRRRGGGGGAGGGGAIAPPVAAAGTPPPRSPGIGRR